MADQKALLFIGSSSESIEVARAVRENLKDVAVAQIWDEDFFEPGAFALDALLEASQHFDFAVFIFGADDTVKMRKERFVVARDNVVFELGIFMERLGKSRAFILVPDVRPPVHFPSDLGGLTYVPYDAGSTLPMTARLGSACNKIRRMIKKHGLLLDSAKLPASLVEGCSNLTRLLISMVGNDDYVSAPPTKRLAILYQAAHRHAHKMVEEYWPGKGAALSLKLVDPLAPTFFKCHYDLVHLPDRHRSHDGQPCHQRVPIDGSLPGIAWSSNEPLIRGRLEDLNGSLDSGYFESIRGKIGSFVAWPLFLLGGKTEPIGVMTLDFHAANAVDENDKCLRGFLRALAANFELAFKLGLLNSQKVRRALKGARKHKV